ncbi:hypothetical protein K9N68_21795 [Kovacikia minuta CCNUW1]|uniref:hypothetical protein n=1 Tax=Kovacikia minuta TaxID=2931930 RepID=UPI001CCE2C1D|nr:hypothetical protein [Kovacikia minuta]UBF24324.1 hypothetical protein K9N68_21795 [Kovacikia minuta CCNUW1]
MDSTKKRLLRSILVAGLLGMETAATAIAALAIPPLQPPMLLAQQMNGRIATLQCGGYTITIRFVGDASSNTFSYQTRGLFLNNGVQEGNDYIFYNNDYEYRVTTIGGGTGRLQVFHYGERVLSKQCTWN